MKSLINFLTEVTIFQLFLLVIYLFIFQRTQKNKILAWFLISNLIYLVYYYIFNFTGAFTALRPYLYRIGSNFKFLFGPLLYLYTRSYTDHSPGLRQKDIFHFFPFFITTIFFLFTFHFYGISQKMVLISTGAYYQKYKYLIITTHWLFQVHVMTYLFLSLVVIKKFRITLKSNFSNITKIRLVWLQIIIYSFMMMWLVDLMNYSLTSFLNYSHHEDIFVLVSIAINLVGTVMIVFKGLSNPEVFQGSSETSGLAAARYETSPLSPELKETFRQNLLNYIETEKPYLDPGLTLEQLADKVGIQRNYLSQIINETLGRNFYDFINMYRIAVAREILSQERSSGYSILRMLYTVGFNSKSSFYKAFRKETGMTPVAYRRKVNT